MLSATADAGGAPLTESTPWYIYAGALAVLLAFSKVATNIASEALSGIEDEG